MRTKTNRRAAKAAPSEAKAPSPLRSAGALHKAMDDGSPMECGGNDAALAGDALGSVPKNLPISEMAEQIELPEGWRLRRLGELITRPQYGLTASAMADPSGPRFLRITDIQESGVDWATVPSCDCDKATFERLKLLPGDVVVARIGATTGKAHLIRDKVNAVFASYLIRLRTNDELEPEFLHCFTNSAAYWRQIDAVKGGRLKQGVNIPLLESLELALPPLPEQQAIATVLRTVQGAKEARERVLAATRQLKQALLHHLFTYGAVPVDQAAQVELRTTEFGNVPESWPASVLSGCAHVQTGVAKGRNLEGSEVVELPYLRVANVEMKTIQLRQREVARFLLQPGDVVLTEGGDFDKLGRGFIWQGQISPCVHQNHIFAVRPNRAKLLPEFLAYLAQSSYGKAYFLSVAHKTTNLACINTTKLKALPVLLPPLPDQREITAQLAAVDAKLAAEESRRLALVALFQSLLHHLMTGQVRVPLDCGGSDAALASRGARSRT